MRGVNSKPVKAGVSSGGSCERGSERGGVRGRGRLSERELGLRGNGQRVLSDAVDVASLDARVIRVSVDEGSIAGRPEDDEVDPSSGSQETDFFGLCVRCRRGSSSVSIASCDARRPCAARSCR